MEIITNPSRNDWGRLLLRPIMDFSDIEKIVSNIIFEVKRDGDLALTRFAEKFDKVNLETLLVTNTEFEEASASVNQDLKDAIELAIQNIEKFHKAQSVQEPVVETMQGVKCWRKSVAVEKVGLYVPGGTAPLFSTVLMLGVPAKIAGCKDVVLCTPPNKEGKIHPAILYSAKRIGITQVVKTGGAQAIAAMAFGTQSVPRVYKIFGPGNQFVTVAKMLVAKEGMAIDMPAGPSEVMVVADETANPAFVASDLLSQAEHGVDSQSILLTLDEAFAKSVVKEVAEQLEQLPRKELAAKALGHSKLIVAGSQEDLVDIMNEYGPEHLILAVKDYGQLAEKVINAGSVFLGNYSPESAGDYASGTNHTLPTNGFAKNYSGVSLDSFVKKITFQELTQEGLKKIGPAVELMAAEEQLDAHKNAVSLRIK